jgi:Ca2+-binding EF-hand superfamily protein
MIVPCDPTSSSRLLARVAPYENLGFESIELMRRLMRAHLSLAQAQEYIKIRLNRQMNAEGWSAEDIYAAIDIEQKGWISIYDLEKLLINHKRGGSRSLVSDIELLIALYDKTQNKHIRLNDFVQEI